ncbi:multidrug effflux MFS transporter [Vibrio tritonius]|uniref:multidrug effflux MFS transporter n=1 Tax=Vibrio tritonius TaxID=1435069 RepID=UPI00315D0481
MNLLSTDRFRKTPLLLAMMIIATGQVGVSIYLPSLPLISQDLLVGQARVQMLVTLFLIGFGGSQLFYGALSDAIGRRPVFLLGQGIYLLGTVICVVLADQFSTLEFGRLLQGLGAGSASVLGRSVLRDCYDGPYLTKALSYMSVTASIMPIVAPVLGGWLAYQLSWHAVFVFVLCYISAIFALGMFILPETLPYEKHRFDPIMVVKNYVSLLTNVQVISSASYNWISYLSAMVTLSVLPFLMQIQLGMTAADYGTLMIVPSLGLLSGSIAVNVLHRYYGIKPIFCLSIGLIFASAAVLLLVPFSVVGLIIAFTVLSFAQGISFPMATTMLLSPHKKQAGAVAALSGSVQMCLAGIFGGYVVEHWVTSQHSLGVFYLLVAIATGTIFVTTFRYQNVAAPAHAAS